MSDEALPGRVRYPGLDGVRAFAMIAVFLMHYNPWPSSHTVSDLAAQGYAGVMIFFVLSGFLITGILWDSRFKQHRLRDFYARRILRIFPLYYTFWFCLLLSTWLLHWHWNWRWLLYLVHLGNLGRFIFYNAHDPSWLDLLHGTTNWWPTLPLNHLWSLCVEEQFYLFWPWLVYRCSTQQGLRKLCAIFVLLAPILRVVVTLVAPKHLLGIDLIYRSMPTEVDAMAWGGLLAAAIRGPEGKILRQYNGAISLLLGSAPVFFLCICRIHYGTLLLGVSRSVTTLIALPAMDLLGVALVLRSIHPGSEMERLFSWKPIAAFGTVTYGFYLLHSLPIDFSEKVARTLAPGPAQALVTTLVAFICTLALAVSSYQFLEKPFLNLKRKFGEQVHKAVQA